MGTDLLAVATVAYIMCATDFSIAFFVGGDPFLCMLLFGVATTDSYTTRFLASDPSSCRALGNTHTVFHVHTPTNKIYLRPLQ